MRHSCGTYQWEPSSYYSNFDEYFQDYHSTWTSIPTDVYDQRITLQYQWVSNAHDIYGKRERFETVPVDVTVVGEKTVTQWGTEAISEAQTTLVTARIPDTTLVQAGTFQAPAMQSAGAMVLHAGGHAILRGRFTSSSGSVRLASGENMLIDGRLPDGILPSNTVAAIGEVSSPVSIGLESGDLVLTESGYLRVSDGTDYPTAAVTILSTGDVTLSGRIASPTNFQLAAADSVLLDGSIHAGESIRITAGQGSQNQGDITGTFFADLVTAGDDRRIELTAGTAGGSITLVDSDLLSDYVSLHAVSGAVSHGPGGLIDAATLHMLSSAGVSARARSGRCYGNRLDGR
jgi:hypothetical protein